MGFILYRIRIEFLYDWLKFALCDTSCVPAETGKKIAHIAGALKIKTQYLAVCLTVLEL